ncbi:major facilitator superfamily transporter [Microdochium bolleyi]|uniref:Major facilitator superfamily transporter n=1 Tax=Microdochium bolleyi TaxID=196109 RepID=A0A136INJ9_9PEZI|nr:major facilitator superfamily transporter [Microdochium bolleyi]
MHAQGEEADGLNPAVDCPSAWTPMRKWWTVLLLAFSSFCVTFGCLWVAPLANGIVEDLNNTGGDSSTTDNDGSSAAVILVTIWELGEATGPLLIGPLSETFGRLPLYMAANALFTLATALGAMSNSIELLTASRALTGLAVAANVLNPAVVGDIFPPEQRGAAMSCITIAPLLASAVAPLTSSLVGSILGWRAVVWLSVLLSASCQLLFLVGFRETYYPIIVAASTQGSGCRCSTDIAEDQPLVLELMISIRRPFVVFFGSGVLMSLSAFGAVCYSYFYIISTTLPNILEQTYSFAPGTTGWAFCANGIGTLIGVWICHRNLDRIYINLTKNAAKHGQPEYRLPLSILGVVTLPPAVALYGWSAALHLPLPLFLLSIVWIRASMTLAALPLMPYVVDACGAFSASALTGLIVVRCLAGAFLPLATAALVRSDGGLGYGWGFTVMAGVNLLFGMVPVVLFRYGERWRAGSVYTSTPR